MDNFIIIAIIAAVVGFGVYSSVKHFRGEGGCCGGGSYKPKKKRLSAVQYQKVFIVEGMHCDHCKSRVEEAVNDIHGVAGKVALKRKELLISYEEDVSDDTICARIEKAGYTVTEIKDK